MAEAESRNEQGKSERRFDPELLKKGLRCDLDQYDMLLRCSEKQDMTEWNEWREKHPDEHILLEGACLVNVHQENGKISSRNDLEGLKGHLGGIGDVRLTGLYLEGANLRDAHLEKAYLIDARLRGTKLAFGHLEGAQFMGAHLEDADLGIAHLEGADFTRADLRGATFYLATVDGLTLIWLCKIDRRTDFRCVGLDSIRIDAGTKQLLEYNIRRKNWEDWYEKHWFWRWPVQLFWLMSDYGMSTLRVVGVFFLLAFLFAGIYMNCAYWQPPGIIDNLIVEPAIEQEMSVVYYFLLALVRPIYFSIVTMTTLGFGDMYANKGSIAGHVILAVQVILGYVLLGALITRFAVLFTAGGPAGTFAKEKKVDSVSPDNGIRGQARME